MIKTEKYWIKFLSPGSFCSNEWNIDCEKHTKPEDVCIPPNAYAFTMHKRIEVLDWFNVYKGADEQIGLIYYHEDSKVETIGEAALNPNSSDILVRNMECNKWEKIIWTRWGN